jgi:hypothetical protein
MAFSRHQAKSERRRRRALSHHDGSAGKRFDVYVQFRQTPKGTAADIRETVERIVRSTFRDKVTGVSISLWRRCRSLVLRHAGEAFTHAQSAEAAHLWERPACSAPEEVPAARTAEVHQPTYRDEGT